MATFDDHQNLAVGTVDTAPSPGTSGTTLVVDTGVTWPAVPFNATVWPQGQAPTQSNAEIIRVTNIAGDTWTIERAQEGTTARDIRNNDQVANTATDKVFTDIEGAITSIVDVISNMISAGAGGVSVVSAEHASVDARVTSVEAHVDTLSAVVSVISQQVSVLSQQVSILSQAHSALSQQVSVLSGQLSLTNSALGSVDAHASAASAAATSVDARVNTVSNLVSALTSAHNALSNVVSAAGLGPVINMISLQNVDASAVSAGAPVYVFTSANTFKRADASAVGAELVVGLVADASIGVSAVGRIQTHGKVTLTTAQWDDIAGTTGGLTPGTVYYLDTTAGMLTDTEPTGSAVVHPVGQALSPTELQLMLTPWDDSTSVLSVLSAAITSLDTRINSVNTALSALSARTTAAASIHGIQSIINALSNRISAAGGGSGSVTSAELVSLLNVVSAQAASALSDAISVGSATASNLLSNINAVSDAHSVLSQRVSVLSGELSLTNSALGSVDAHASAASAAATSVLNFVQGVSTRSALSATVSTKGLQSALDALSNRISLNAKAISDMISAGGGGVSVTSADLVSALAGVAGGFVSMQNVDASAVSAGMAVYAFTSANTFKRADASATGTELVLGLVADAAIAVSATGRIQINGVISLTSAQWSDVTSVGTGLTPGDIYYLHSTAGRITTTLLSAPAVRHIVGQALSPNQLNLLLTPFDDDTSAINNLSERISALEAGGGGGGSVTSNQHSALSEKVVSISAQLVSINARATSIEALLSNAISAGSATASAICALLSAVSARSALSATVSTHGLQSVIDALSNRISLNAKAISDIISAGGGGVSVTSADLASVDTHANAASAAATSVDARVNALSDLHSVLSQAHSALSQRVSVLSGELSLTNSALGSVDAHANAASAAATSVNSRVNSVNTFISGISARSAGDVSTHGFQSIIDALSGRITGGSGSVTSQEFSVLSQKVSLLSSQVSTVSENATAADVHASTASAAATSVNARVNSVNTALSAISARTEAPASVHGLQSIVDALSLRIINESNRIGDVSADATSIDNRVNSVNTALSAISARSALSATVSTHGLQSIVDALSNRISLAAKAISDIISAGGGGVSITSADLFSVLGTFSARSALSAGVSTKGLQSIIDALSNRISINAATISDAISVGSTTASNLLSNINVLSTTVNRTRYFYLANDTNVSAGALTTIAGLSAAISASGIYEMQAQVGFTISTGQLVGFGLNFGGMTNAMGQMKYTNIGQDSNQSTTSTVNAAFDENGSGSIVLSVYASVGGGTGVRNVTYQAVFAVSTSAPTPIHLLAKASTGTGEIVLKKGSYLRIYKMN